LFNFAIIFIEPAPKRILFIGLGIGVLPRTLDKILKDYEKIDVVEIDPDIVEIAKKYFFFKPNDKLKVHIQDGFEFVMSLNEQQTYDLIIMDAFGEGICAPDVFFNPEYVLKLKKQLTPDGIITVNTLLGCVRHEEELSLYKSAFDDYYISEIIAINRILFLFNGQIPRLKQIKKNAKALNSLLSSLDVNTKWIVDFGFGS
jgi:spermidine synthase